MLFKENRSNGFHLGISSGLLHSLKGYLYSSILLKEKDPIRMSKKLLGKNVWNSMNDKEDQILNDPVLV